MSNQTVETKATAKLSLLAVLSTSVDVNAYVKTLTDDHTDPT